jgi:hypothetical protein
MGWDSQLAFHCEAIDVPYESEAKLCERKSHETNGQAFVNNCSEKKALADRLGPKITDDGHF